MSAAKLLTFFKGVRVASDSYGNQYYREGFFFGKPKDRQPRRWVVYSGRAEGSKVPAEWHAWLHFTTDKTPEEVPPVNYKWEKPHEPNLTGTKKAYEPPVNRAATYYGAWQPDNDK